MSTNLALAESVHHFTSEVTETIYLLEEFKKLENDGWVTVPVTTLTSLQNILRQNNDLIRTLSEALLKISSKISDLTKDD